MKLWYALYTKPRVETQVSSYLVARGIETFLPMLSTYMVRAGKKVQVIQPLFPCYLFAQPDFDIVSVSAVRWAPGLRDLVTFSDRPAIVQPEVIEHVRRRLGEGEIQRQPERPRFEPDAPVRLRDGPLGGLDAVFEQALPGNVRARILIQILGRMARTEVGIDDLEPRSAGREPGVAPPSRRAA